MPEINLSQLQYALASPIADYDPFCHALTVSAGLFPLTKCLEERKKEGEERKERERREGMKKIALTIAVFP